MSVHSFETMGTVVSVRVPDLVDTFSEGATQVRAIQLDAAVATGEAAFAKLDARFSLYRDDSEISRIARGELQLADSSDEMRKAYAEALEWRDRTQYTFTPHRPDGVIDLSGTVKALGIQALADSLFAAGFFHFLINAGGDVLAAGTTESGWRVGIANPKDSDTLLGVIELADPWHAMATSGNAQRGDHIWRRPDTDLTFIQASVVAADIMTADVLATTIIAGGQDSLDFVTHNFDVAVHVVKSDGSTLANAKFSDLLVD